MSNNADFSRQGFLGENSEEILGNARVAIIGLGGGGAHIAQQLAHMGVGDIRVIDPQSIEASNLNRLVGATHADVQNQTPKVTIAKRLIENIRPWIKVTAIQAEWQMATDQLKNVHAIFGCVDGYRQRQNIERAARRFQIPYIDIGMDVSEIEPNHFAVAGQVIKTLPGGPCMTCMGFLTQDKLNREENNYGDAGINPQVVWTNGTLASLAVGSFAQMIVPWFDVKNTFEWLELDGNSQTITHSRQPRYMINGSCEHFRSEEVGDPFFDLAQQNFAVAG